MASSIHDQNVACLAIDHDIMDMLGINRPFSCDVTGLLRAH